MNQLQLLYVLFVFQEPVYPISFELNLIYYNFIQSKDTKLDIDMDFLMFPVRVEMIHFLKYKKNVI